MVNYEFLENRTLRLQQEFRGASPFAHIVIEPFLQEAAAEAVYSEFPRVDAAFRRHIHGHSRKYASNDWATFPAPIANVCKELNGERFVRLLSELTGIAPLYPDPGLVGGGVHLITRGGFLDIHADFNEHPVLKKKRCLNLLVYFNRNWKREYQGALELWDQDMRRPVRTISPELNRCVIFETGTTSFHGHPAPLACPEGLARQSLALYYYTDWTGENERRLTTTEYQLRSSDYAGRAKTAVKTLLGARLSNRIGARFLHRDGRGQS